ncbi:guanine nucleotide binding protein, alpha subunit [Infundibulicybe gibba]|nr:guanine nucleotide binding protein, alpha subunit [Infundibulicybe gibba]
MPTVAMIRFPEGDSDPITKALAPPPDETPAEREARLLSEKEAKVVSDAIDEDLAKQRAAEKKSPKAVKVLLLGQSESGKSTTLKNFQLMYEPKAFRTERASWRAVIQLNIVRSIHLILEAMGRAQANAHTPSGSELPQLTPDLLKLKMRLAPLLQVEEVLTRRITPGGVEELRLAPATPYSERSRNFVREVAVNSAAQWKGAFSRASDGDRESFDSKQPVDLDNEQDTGVVLHACSDDMRRLWNDPIVQELLEKQNLRLEELAGFFLDSLDRVTSLGYVPSDDDILRARLKTLGVSEHRFKIAFSTAGSASVGTDWRVFDVGGHRSLRAAWAPYFDDMDAIIFLAPISCFDQVLAEDHKINRLEDSFNLWTSIVSNPLLKNTNLILFLNKIDIMKSKLASGIKLADYVVSYGERPNDFENTSTCKRLLYLHANPDDLLYIDLRRKFGGILKESSPVKRVFYCHLTAVTDTKSTTYILTNIKDMLMRQNLERSALMT